MSTTSPAIAPPALAPAPAARRARRLLPSGRRHLLVPAVIGVALLLTEGLAQAVTPFIRQDDWPFLLPANTHGVLPPSYYDSSEGRWLNTAWWSLIGRHGGPTSAALTYAVAYALLVAGLWRVLRHARIRPRPAVDALLGIALYASAVWVQLLYWPGTLTPSVVVGATAAWLLPWAARSPRRLLMWIAIAEVAAVLSYPPVGVVLLLFVVLLRRDAAWRQILSVIGAWLASFALGVLVAYTLNWVVYGHFGLQLASWRNPNPLTSLGALAVNAGRWLSAARTLWTAQWWVAVVGVVAVVLGRRDATVRPRLDRLLVAFAVACGLDAVQTLVTGVVTDARGQLWTWLVAVLPVALLLDGRRRLHVGLPGRGWLAVDRVAAVVLAALAAGGVLSWRADIGEHQAVRQQYAAIADAATAHAHGTGAPTVVVYQDPALKRTRAGRIMASTLVMAVRQDLHGGLPHWCKGVECLEVMSHSSTGPVVHLGHEGRRADVVGIIVPTPPSWI